MDDWQLIEDYAQRGSEAAFRTLVDRHFSLVRASALRHVNDTQLADEVSQAVFILLARKARSLRRGVVLVGWLFRTTRFVAARAVRGEQRRQRREQEALAMQSLTAPDETWKRISPVLDEALAQLPDGDRNAVLLRFCEGQNHQQVGAVLGMTEEAARKRVSRGLERLRGFFARRGFTLSAAGLASVLATNAAPAAPAGLAAGVAATALANSVAGAGALPAIVQETLAAWRWAKVKLSVACATGVASLVGVGIWIAPIKPAASPVELQGVQASVSPTIEPSEEAQRPLAPKAQSPAKQGESVLRLQVVARDNGEPAANAPLVVNTVVGSDWKKRFDLATDEAGVAEVTYPVGAGRLDVGVLAWGWAARFATWRPKPEDPIPSEYTLRLDRVTNSMGGRVCDAADRPVANAEIVVSFHSTGDASHRETPRERPGIMGEAVIAKTDLQGHWSSAAIPLSGHGGFEFRVRHPEFRTTSAAYAGAEIELSNPQNETQRLLVAGNLVTRLVAGPTLVGRVLDETDQPVASAQIVHSPASNEALSAMTDAGGYFSFANLEHTMFDFAVTAQGFAPEYRSVMLSGGVETVEVRLHPGARLRLRLVDEQGVPVSNATVSLEQWGEQRQKLMWHAQSGADGRIEWSSAPSKSRLELYAVKEGWCYTRDIKVQADEQEHQITMRRALVVTGRVTDAKTGQPVVEVKAFPGYGDGEYMWERLDTRRTSSGYFTVELTENKLPWRVRVEAEGYAPFVSEPLPQDFSSPLEIALQPLDSRNAIRGVVLRPDGQPAGGADVTLLSLEHDVQLDGHRLRSEIGLRLIETTDSEGRFAFRGEPNTHTVVAASAEGFAKRRVRNPAEPVTLRLESWGRIEGVVPARARARPVEAVVLEDPAFRNYQGQVSLGFRQTKPHNEGRFSFDCVPPLTLCLSLNSGVGIPFHHSTVVKISPGETANVVVAGNGWPVKGRLLAPEDAAVAWAKQLVFAKIEAGRTVRPPAELDATAAANWLVDFWDSDAGRQLAATLHSYDLTVSGDGSFLSDNTLAPGDYQIFVATRTGNYRNQVTISAPAEEGSEVCDLGAVVLSRQ